MVTKHKTKKAKPQLSTIRPKIPWLMTMKYSMEVDNATQKNRREHMTNLHNRKQFTATQQRTENKQDTAQHVNTSKQNEHTTPQRSITKY